MDKQYYNRGFTMVEMILVLFIISSVSILVLPLLRLPNMEDMQFANEYLVQQSECIKMNNQQEYQSEIQANYPYPIIFNYKGNVQMAQTITFPSKHTQLVSQLGGGRIEIK
ncbi:type II secretion system protein [Anaerorhabdus furcosa]|nr:type II secretion system protein [Anaerorhabdus furcosa]